jgi:hypothetical protein
MANTLLRLKRVANRINETLLLKKSGIDRIEETRISCLRNVLHITRLGNKTQYGHQKE